MRITVDPFHPSGSVDANRSKSYTQRYYALAGLSSKPTKIINPSWCDDACAALAIAGDMGTEIQFEDNAVVLSPGRTAVADKWFAGESGLSLRMFSPIAALSGREVTIDGSGSLQQRPVNVVTDALAVLGVKVSSGNLPLVIKGPIKPAQYTIDGSMSSQVLTGLLIAMPLLTGQSTLFVDHLKSRPYIDMTLHAIEDFGVKIRNDEFRTFHIPGQCSYKGGTHEVEADWSGIAFLLVMSAISGNVRTTGVYRDSVQADAAIVDVLESTGCRVVFEGDHCTVERPDTLEAFEFDATHCPDLFPPLCLLATQCHGTCVLRGVSRLAHKESDRANVLKTEFAKLGAHIEIDGDEMRIDGPQPLSGAETDSNNDHRIAMALACAATVSNGPVVINGAEAVTKSYPDFYVDLMSVGARIQGLNDLNYKRSGDYYLEYLAKHHK